MRSYSWATFLSCLLVFVFLCQSTGSFVFIFFLSLCPLVFCQIPCLNGGRCIGQNECWCPSNSTGKFCHLPAPTPSKPTPSRRANSNGGQNGSSHSMYTLPLSNQQGKDCMKSFWSTDKENHRQQKPAGMLGSCPVVVL